MDPLQVSNYQPDLNTCDVICLLYDCTNGRSFQYIAKIYEVCHVIAFLHFVFVIIAIPCFEYCVNKTDKLLFYLKIEKLFLPTLCQVMVGSKKKH